MANPEEVDPFVWQADKPNFKPAKGTARAKRVEKRVKVETKESSEKTKVRLRDGYTCRWPHCDCRQRRDRIEVAHLDDKGMGGDHGTRSHASQMITLCLARHQGKPSLHSGDLKVVPLTDEGTKGPCEFWATDENDQWYLVAREREPFVYERD